MNAVVVGAGITGLGAAHALVQAGVDVRLIEASPRAGGLVRTEQMQGFLLEHGPDSILASKPAAQRALRELALEAEIVKGGAMRSLVATEDALVPLPPGLFAFTPRAGISVLRSPVLSPLGKLRFTMEPLLPRARHEGDESVASFFARRFGREVSERLVGPLLSGIYATEAESLSIEAVMPHLVRAERNFGSVARATFSRREAMPPPALATLRGGMERLVAALASRIGDRLALDRPVREIRRDGPRRFVVELADGSRLRADAVILALPPWEAARVIEGLDADLAGGLGEIAPASLRSMWLAWERSALGPSLDTTGWVSATKRGHVRACTFSSAKWPGRAPADQVLVKVFFREADDASDTELLAEARRELRDRIGIDVPPIFVKAQRAARTLPRFEVGHLERARRLREREAEHPGLALAGGAFGGIGVPDCLADGERAASQVLMTLGAAAPASPARERTA